MKMCPNELYIPLNYLYFAQSLPRILINFIEGINV